MVKTAGVPFREFRQRIELVTLKINTGCTKGDLLMDNTGYAPATATIADSNAFKPCVALATVVAPTDGSQATVRAMFEGAVGVTKLNNTVVAYGQALGASATAGSVDVCSVANLAKYGAGWAMESAISGDKSVGMMLRA
jgi:hypothetical protein